MKKDSKRRCDESLKSQLENERATFVPQWRDLGENILPMRPRFLTTDVNKGERRNLKIIDSTPTFAAGTLRSGMMSGVTSPARPWFRLSTPETAMNENQAVKTYLHAVQQAMSSVFLKSNLYKSLPTIYGDLGTFGTAALHVDEDMDDVIRSYAHPIGSYTIANDHRGRVNKFTREFSMTVGALVGKFAERDPETNKISNWDNFSDKVKDLFEAGNTEQRVDVCHVIKPNEEFNPKRLESKFKRYTSRYFERGTNSNKSKDKDLFLSEKGYDYFPVLCPRWETTGEDTYGTSCPGMTALGDAKALQLMQRRKAQAIEKMVNPPMKGPPGLLMSQPSILPGALTTSVDSDKYTPAHEVRISISELVQDIQEIQGRIRRAFYEDLFLMLATSDRRDFTAREIDERHEEKLLALGPVLEQLNQDLLDPLIDITFNIMESQGLLPEPPEELQGMKLKIEYISIMAQAQKLVGISGVERFIGFVGQVAQFNPAVLQKIDADQVIDIYADMTSVPPSIVRSDDAVEEMRAAEAQAKQAQQTANMIPGAARAAKDLSQADMSGNSALSALLGTGAVPPA